MKKFSALLFVLIIAFSSSSAFAAEKIKYSQDIANAVRSFLVNDDWKFDFNADRGVFNFGLNIDGKLGKLDYSIRVRENFFTVYAVAPINADRKDPKAMAAMAEFITRANYGLPNGNFEMDFSDGEIRYKSFVPCDDTMPSRSIIRRSITSSRCYVRKIFTGYIRRYYA